MDAEVAEMAAGAEQVEEPPPKTKTMSHQPTEGAEEEVAEVNATIQTDQARKQYQRDW